MDTPLEAGSSTAGALFANSTFRVPQFQREYTWEAPEVEEFFSDLASALNQNSYFLGLVIVTGEENPRDIVDGQQRILTLTLLATALYRAANEHGRAAAADRLRTTFLKDINYETDDEQPRVRLSSTRDDSTLQALVEGEQIDVDSMSKGEVSTRLVKAFEVLDRRLRENIQPDPFKRVGKWADFLTNRLYLARFIHPDPGSAYRVFEIINTRGKELTTADLLKSHVLSQTQENDRSVRYKEWQDLAESFDDTTATFVQFIRHSVTLMKGHVQPKDLYDVLTGRSGTAGDAVGVKQLMDLLHENHVPYMQMVNPSADGPASEAELKVYSTLNSLQVSSVRPILLAIRKCSDPEDGARELLKLVMRRVVVGTLGTGNVERKFGVAARIIEESRNWREGLSELAELNPSYDEFVSKVQNRSLNRNVLSVLRSSILQGNISPDLEGTLYFIRPRSGDWSHADQDRVAYWVSTLGNTFLADVPRRPSGSNDWQGFVNGLLPHAVPGEWVEALKSYAEWNVLAIEQMGGSLAAVAGDVWYA